VVTGQKLDPNQVRDEANALRAKGQYQAALDRYLWYWNHALEYEPGLSAVRLSFLLSDWVELGRPYSKEDAEDLTQGFFASFLARNYLEGVSSEKGRFRAFLLAALKHFLANERDRAGRQKRGGGVPPLSLDWQDADTRYQIDPADLLSPDKLYDRVWAMTLLEQVISRLRDECAAERKGKVFDELKPFLMAGQNAVPYAEAAARLGLNEGAARVAVHRLRKRYRELLREEISQTLSDPADIEEELRALFRAFGE
jgi:RNA polymerase sigma-70 factor (ECF subfamily)